MSNSQVRLVQAVAKPRAKVLFLGYSEAETKLIAALSSVGCEVWHAKEKLTSIGSYDLIVSFGYQHIISKGIIASVGAPIVNLHISYLPWNRGAHPNFWSFFDETPNGVTIHLIDEGLDTGPILYQRKIVFSSEEETFFSTYGKLVGEIEDLFISHIYSIIKKDFIPLPQEGKGSYHRSSDLPREFLGWHSNIKLEIDRLRKIPRMK